MISRNVALVGLGSFALVAVTLGCGGAEGARGGSGEQWHGRIYPYAAGQLATSNSVANATMSRTSPTTVRATTTLRGGLAMGRYPWHVHEGPCEEGGAILGDPDEYPVLVPDAQGMGTANATFEARLDPGAAYSINIHRSPDEIGTIVACGDLTRG